MEYYNEMNNEELYHYGVKGMKWGVRRDARILANNRRNKAVKKIKDDYDRGKISNEKKNQLIKNENAKKKAYISETKAKLKGLKTTTDVDPISTKLNKQLVSEVPNHRMKRGMATAAMVLEGIGNASVAAIGISTMATVPGSAAVMVPAMAIDVAANRGRRVVSDMILDKFS